MGNQIPAFSEEALALCAVHKYGADWLHAADLSHWYRWNSERFEHDNKRGIFNVGRSVCRDFSALAMQDKKTEALALKLASAKTRAAVVSLMSEDPRIAIASSELDRDPMLLGVPAGVIDLRTGELLSPNRKYRITMSTAVTPAPPGTPHPLWDEFLRSTFPVVPGQPEPDCELIDHLQRSAGYSLTGDTRDEKFSFLHGTGRNGKGVWLETLLGVMGDYGTVLPSETLMERPVEPHRAELAVLRGKRLVVTNEIPSGKRWNQSRLMDLTGGGEISANLMRRDPVTFRIQGHLWIAGNSKPAFPTTNLAASDCLMLVRFRMHFLKADEDLRNDPTIKACDKNLKTELRVEYPSILRWLVDGCLKWQESGLAIPKTVIDDSADYLADSDDLGQWIADCCTTDPASTGGGAMRELFASWNLWRQGRQEKPTTYPQFRERVKDRFNVTKASYGKKVVGLFLTDFARAEVLRDKEQKERWRANGADAGAGIAMEVRCQIAEAELENDRGRMVEGIRARNARAAATKPNRSAPRPPCAAAWRCSAKSARKASGIITLSSPRPAIAGRLRRNSPRKVAFTSTHCAPSITAWRCAFIPTTRAAGHQIMVGVNLFMDCIKRKLDGE